uniref:Putative salivary kunitz domain protein n=1 Tax=Ixodes ricinus TaxID=34613 RepID=A0A0K8R5Z3_IXORI
MKAILAVTCFFSAVMLISALPKEVCDSPYATPSCGPNAAVGIFYYYDMNTKRCESEFSCRGPRNYPSEKECQEECPNGKYASSG